MVMKLSDFLYYQQELRGFKIMGMKIELSQQFRENVQKFEEFKKSLDLSPIREYFQLGVKAKVFKNRDGKTLTDKDNLWMGFNEKGYQYLLVRRPLPKKDNSIIEKILREQGLI